MKRQRIDLYTGPTTLGIDVSAYQGEIDWPRVVAGEAVWHRRSVGPVRYAIVRSSDGVQTRRHSKPDPMAVRNLTGAHEAGLPVGLYHFLRAYHGADEQTELILDVIRTAAAPIGCVVLDVEGRPDDPRTPDTDESRGAWWIPDDAEGPVETSDVLADLVDMTLALQSLGHRVLIYSGASWHAFISQRRLEVPVVLQRLGLWVPSYTRNAAPRLPVGPGSEPWPWAEWQIWQFSGRGAVPGIRGNVDLNRWRGDEDALRRWWDPAHRSTPPAPAPAWERDEISALAERAESAGDCDAASALLDARMRLGQ